tara:strand:+ start:585 stop:1652 length:1068 start_codon:yes stop_codon:yes gene_type:complete
MIKNILNISKAVYSAQKNEEIFHLIYFVTARCNARCKFCFYLDNIELANQNLSKELKIDEIKQIFKFAGYIPYISLSGGEPFLRNDLDEIIRIIIKYSKPLMISIPTNGSYPEKIEKKLNNLLNDHSETEINIQLSIDAPEKKHDEIRQIPGLFSKMIETNSVVKKLSTKYKNLSTKIVITYSTFNQDEVEELIDFSKKNFFFNRMILSKVHGNAKGKSGLDFSHFKKLLSKVDEINKEKNNNRSLITKLSLLVKKTKEKIRSDFEKDKNLGKYCNASKKIVVLSEYGDVYPCEVLSTKLGNVKNYNYNLKSLLALNSNEFIKSNNIKSSCHCDWGCAQNVALVSNKKLWVNFVK